MRSSLRAIQTRGVVRVAVLDDLPGFAFKDPSTGLRSGLDIEISKFMAQGIFGGTLEEATEHIEFIDIKANQREFACSQGLADFVVSAFTVTDERRRTNDFTQPYHGTSLAMICHSDQAEPNISDATVAVVESSTCHAYVRQQEIGQKVLTFENTSDVPAAVASGNAQVGVIMSALVDGFAQIGQLPIRRMKQHPIVFDPWAVAVRKGNDELREFLDQRLNTLLTPFDAPISA